MHTSNNENDRAFKHVAGNETTKYICRYKIGNIL